MKYIHIYKYTGCLEIILVEIDILHWKYNRDDEN